MYLYHFHTSRRAAQLSGKKLFTLVAMKDRFCHIKLTKEAFHLCCFNTPWGRIQFCRMPFGILWASEVMQKLNDKAFGELPGVHVMADGIIIVAATEDEDDATLQQLVERAQQENVKFNSKKIQYKVP